MHNSRGKFQSINLVLQHSSSFTQQKIHTFESTEYVLNRNITNWQKCHQALFPGGIPER